MHTASQCLPIYNRQMQKRESYMIRPVSRKKLCYFLKTAKISVVASIFITLNPFNKQCLSSNSTSLWTVSYLTKSSYGTRWLFKHISAKLKLVYRNGGSDPSDWKKKRFSLWKLTSQFGSCVPLKKGGMKNHVKSTKLFCRKTLQSKISMPPIAKNVRKLSVFMSA